MNKTEILDTKLYIPETDGVRTIAQGDYIDKTESEVRGSGYVIESLEAALWCFANTDSFNEAVLTAANLGDDADTTAAITGQIAGTYYGINNINKHWREQLTMIDEILELADRLNRSSDA